MLNLPDNNFFSSPEPHRSSLIFLRDFILQYSDRITEKWSNNTPFYYYNKKSICFISYDPKTKIIYISFTNGYLLKHKKLLSEGRKKMKIFYVDPTVDIDVKSLKAILSSACGLLLKS